MIKIVFYLNGMIVDGHSNKMPSGQDVLCAGVSAITIGSLNWFDEDHVNIDLNDGYLKLQIIQLNDHNKLLLNLIQKQLSAIPKDKKHLNITFKNQKI